jgi:hypothetical protein
MIIHLLTEASSTRKVLHLAQFQVQQERSSSCSGWTEHDGNRPRPLGKMERIAITSPRQRSDVPKRSATAMLWNRREDLSIVAKHLRLV